MVPCRLLNLKINYNLSRPAFQCLSHTSTRTVSYKGYMKHLQQSRKCPRLHWFFIQEHGLQFSTCYSFLGDCVCVLCPSPELHFHFPKLRSSSVQNCVLERLQTLEARPFWAVLFSPAVGLRATHFTSLSSQLLCLLVCPFNPCDGHLNHFLVGLLKTT